MAGEIHGSKAEFKVDNSAEVLTVVDGGESAQLEEAIDTAETSQFGDTAKKFIPGLSEGDITFEASWTPTNVALLRGIKGLVRDFEYFPAGNSTGNEKCSGQLIVTGITRSSPVDGKTKLTGKFKVTGAVTAATI